MVATEAERSTTIGEVFGLHARTAADDDQSAGLVAESLSTTGDVVGLRAVAASDQGAAAAFFNLGGGSPLAALDAGVTVFEVDADATLTATAFVGDASLVFDVGDVECAGCVGGEALDLLVVDGAHLQGDAVTGPKIAPGAVQASHLRTGSVTAAKLALASVTAAKLASASVTSTHLQSGAVGAAQLGDGAVGGSEVWTDAVRRRHLGLTSAPFLLYTTHDDCLGGGLLNYASSCDSRECGGGLYYNCFGVCALPVSIGCPNTAVGYLVEPPPGG